MSRVRYFKAKKFTDSEKVAKWLNDLEKKKEVGSVTVVSHSLSGDKSEVIVLVKP